MKIGILTFHRAHNYGALLQAYALGTYLESQGHDVSFVDYMPEWHADNYRVWNALSFRRRSIIGKLKYILLWILTVGRKTRRYNSFQRFITSYLGLPKYAEYTYSPIQLKDNYDYIVVGSDQIWRNWIVSGCYIGFDSVYFGEGVNPKPKYITYAASMGIIDYNEEEREFLKWALKNFEQISVRERNLQNELQTLGYNSCLVVDPTFLLSREHWNALLPKERYQKDKYVLFYHLLGSDDAQKLAERVAFELNCKLLTVTAGVKFKPQNNVIETAGPIEFLHMIRDAEFVVATSFHGTAFSIIFKKSFYALGIGKNAGRVVSLLSKLGIEDRYIDGNILEVQISTPLFIDEKIAEYVTESKNYLTNALI